MKPRRWVVVVFSCILIAVLGLFEGVRNIEKSRHLERLLTQQLSAASGGDVTVGRVRLGFFSVLLQNVDASLSMHAYSLNIRDIKVSFSLLKLFSTHGDFSKSISKIMLISPTLDFRLFAPLSVTGAPAGAISGASPGAQPIESAKLLATFRSLPVDFLLVRKGTVTLSAGASAPRMLLGEELSGRMWEDEAGVSLDLRGKMASRKKNMVLTAAISRTGRNHRVSLRLDKAEISKPLRLGHAQIASGVLDGVVELSFPDSVSAATFESNGWVRISNGSCAIDGMDSAFSSMGLFAQLSNTTLRVDSLRCGFRGMDLAGKGDWNFSSAPSAQTGMLVRCQGIRPEQLVFFPSGSLKNITGQGWLEVKCVRRKNTGRRDFTFQAGGLNIGGQPVTLVAGAGLWEGSQVSVDSMSISGPGFSARGSGIVNYEKPPVAYSVSYSCRFDSLKAVRSLHGQISVSGSVRGLGADYFCDAVCGSKSLSWAGIPLGSPEIKVSLSRGRALSFSSTPDNAEFVTVMGMVDSIGTSPRPVITCNASVGTSTMRALLGRLTPLSGRTIDSAWAKAAFKGTDGAFSVNGFAGISAPSGTPSSPGAAGIRGALGIQIDKKDNEKSIRWQLFPQELTAAGIGLALRGGGTFSGDSLRVDSLSALSGVKASGLVRFGAPAGGAGPEILMTVAYRDVSLVQLTTLALGGGFPFRKGSVWGTTRVGGQMPHIRTDSDIHIRGASLPFAANLETDISCTTLDTVWTVLPLTLRQDGHTLVTVDTASNAHGIRFSGRFSNVEILPLIKDILPEDFTKEDHVITGMVSGTFASASAGESPGATPEVTSSASGRAPVADVSLHSWRIAVDGWRLDSVTATLVCGDRGLALKSLMASDSSRLRIRAGGFVPWSAFSDEQPEDDTLTLWATAAGDIVASVEHNVSAPFNLPISGHGLGTIDVAVRAVAGNYQVSRAIAQIPRGTLRIRPYVPGEIKDFSLKAAMDNPLHVEGGAAADADAERENARISIVMNGMIGRRPVTIHSTHDIPSGFEPLTAGIFDFGALLVSTPKHGIDVHVPGLTEIGAVSDVEFAPKAPWPEFALSGPFDKLCISGVWILRGVDLTFPMLDNTETRVVFNPFPYITWNFDIRAGNRKVKYYYDTGKNRNLMRLVECYVDPVSVLSLRGRDMDATFKILGNLRSSTGSVFYGRTFDRSIDIGLDFVPQPLPGGKGYDNVPIIWGSAEAVSDSSRFDRIKLTLITRDSITNAWSEKGRFYDIHFRVGSNIEDIPGETQEKFVAEERKRYGTVPGAGTFVSTIGEQYLHRIFFQNAERHLAKSLGLDVITFETSIASNYFNKLYNRQFEFSRWDYLALANVGITMGRYILNDKVFLKWRTELVPIDTVLQPQYNVGFEFQPLQYLLMDINYGIHVGDKTLEYNPQLNLELRLPIKDIRKYFSF